MSSQIYEISLPNSVDVSHPTGTWVQSKEHKCPLSESPTAFSVISHMPWKPYIVWTVKHISDAIYADCILCSWNIVICCPMADQRWSKERYVQHLQIVACEDICLSCWMPRIYKWLETILSSMGMGNHIYLNCVRMCVHVFSQILNSPMLPGLPKDWLPSFAVHLQRLPMWRNQ